MPRSYPLTESFNAGELSPRLSARATFQKYRAGLETCVNLIPLAEGGVMRRPGTRHASEIANSAVKGRVKKFEFSTTQAYVLEMGANILRFYRNQARITAGNIAASIANGAFTSDITSWTDRSTGGAGNAIAHDATNGRLTLQTNGTAADDIGWAEQAVTNALAVEHVLKFRVIGAPSDKVQLRIGSASLGTQFVNDVEFEVGYHCYAFTPTAADFYVQFRNLGSFRDKDVQIDDVSLIDNVGINIDTPYAAADLFEIEGPQSNDILYFFHEDYPTYRLERHGHTSWSLEEVAWQDGPYLTENATATTLTFGAATGLGVTVTASAIAGINDGAGFAATDVGRSIRLTDGTVNWGWAVIVGWTSTTVVTADVRRTVVVITAETKWRLGAWSETTGYPSQAAFYEQRLFAAATTDQPQTFWGSQTADFENQAPDSPNSDGTTWAGTVADDDAFDYTLAADNVHTIRWMSPGEDTLVIGTTSGEWIPSSTGAVLTPTDITVRQQTTHGSARVQPVRVDHVVLFVQKAKRKVREFAFSFDVDGFRANDMTRLAEHVTRTGIVEMDFAEEPDSLVWAVRDDGTLLSMTFRREEDVVGWARHVIGGAFQGGNAVVESVTVIPGNNGSGQVKDSSARDEVWMIVKRTLNGATKRYVEFLEKSWERDTDAQEDAYYADSCITLDSPITISGATAADPVVLTATAHGLSNGDENRVTDVVGMTELNDNSYIVAVVDADSVRLLAPELAANITGATATNPVVISTLEDPDVANGDVIGIVGVSGMTQLNGNVYTVAAKTATGFTLSGVDGTAYGAYTLGGSVYHAENGAAYTAYISGGKINKKVTAVSGLTHLEGETVRILGDGAILPDETVASAAITADSSASVMQIGLGYAHTLKTLRMEGGNPAGTAFGRTKQIGGITFVVQDSHTLKFGPDADNLRTVDFRKVDDAMDEAVPYFTGERFEAFDDGWDTDPRIVIESDDPAPFTLLAIAPNIDVKPGA